MRMAEFDTLEQLIHVTLRGKKGGKGGRDVEVARGIERETAGIKRSERH